MTLKEMKKDLLFREARECDKEAIASFFASLGAESTSLFNRRDYNKRGAEKYLSKPDGSRAYFVAELEGKVVALFFFLDYNTLIPELGVAILPEYQGIGLGSEIVGFLIEKAKGEGKGGIILTTHVANLRAQCLYEKFSFKCMGTTKNSTELLYLLKFNS